MSSKTAHLLLLILGSAIALSIGDDDILNDAYRYRELRLEHLRRHRRQQPKEISLQVTAPLFSSRLFDYGADADDKELPIGLDVGKKVDLKNPLRLNNLAYNSVYILSNGGIGFESNSRSYRSNIFSKDTNSIPLIAPFWNRNDLRNGGHVWYREVTAGRILERGQSEIRYQYDKVVPVISCLLVTWEKMQPLGSQILPDENTNTFQAAFFMTQNFTYVNFIYSNIGWTQGAEAGFTTGPGGSDFALPTSGTQNIMFLEEYGNTGIPGEWMFEIQPHRVVRCKAGIKGDICDEECGHGEYGEDCAQCCHCAGDANCNPLNGQCPNDACAECFYGSTCRSKTPVCDERERNSCARNAIGYFSTNKCNEQVVECTCLQGYEGDGRVECLDIDECKTPGTCHENAVCTNTPGHFLCECKEGFTGDGVTECVASFLYGFENHQQLPKTKNSKTSWQLKRPIRIFGQTKDHLTITTSGLILVQDTGKIQSDSLDDVNALGVAPFFAPLDLSKGGSVTVAEVSTPEVLARVGEQINQNAATDGFTPRNVILVTYNNVSSSTSRSTNTYQALIVGGRNKRNNEETYALLLYKDLHWSEGAQAGIMTSEKANSIHLPGSGTEGIEQLSQLSNVRSPGIWLYKIDEADVEPCMQANLQPPYCDAQSPTLVSNKRPTTASNVQPAAPNKGQVTSAASSSSVHTAPSTRHQSTEHRPIVSIHPKDFEDLPDDAFDATFPPFLTVVPQVFTIQPELPPQPSDVQPASTARVSPAESPSTPVNAKPAKPLSPQFEISNDGNGEIIEFTDTVQTIIPSTVSHSHSPKTPALQISPVVDAVQEPVQKIQLQHAQAPVGESMPSTPLQVFPTTTKSTTLAKKPKIILATTKPTTTEASNIETVPFDPNQILEPEAASNNTAIIVPTIIVVVWLLLLIFIALFVCCKRRRSQHQFQTMYDQNYHVRPIATGFAMRKSSRSYEGSFEDHMEKAARLSAEMSSYNPRFGYPARY